MASFLNNLGKLVPECQTNPDTTARDEGQGDRGGSTWLQSEDMCKSSAPNYSQIINTTMPFLVITG